jgi:DNA polymerase I-like protein with 3'-5' exonuclease and polymerase domains
LPLTSETQVSSKYVAIDTETEGVEWEHRPFCMTATWRDSEGELVSHYYELSESDDYSEANKVLRMADYLVMHNAKFDLQKLILVGLLDLGGLQSDRIHNTECIAHLLDEQRLKGLKFLAREILGEDTDEEKVLAQARRDNKLTKADGYDKLPREVVIPYAIKDTEYTLRLFETLYPQLQKHKDLLALYAQEQRLELVLLHMETMGMALDMEYLEGAVKQYAMNILQTELDIQDIAGEDFNPNSPKQVIDWFLANGIALEGTAREVLEPVSHPLAEKILHLRDLKKVHGTYLKPMLQEQRNGILHPNFRQHGTKTGRMSSGGVDE